MKGYLALISGEEIINQQAPNLLDASGHGLDPGRCSPGPRADGRPERITHGFNSGRILAFDVILKITDLDFMDGQLGLDRVAD